MLKDGLVHLVGYFDDYCQILELFPPFGKGVSAYFSNTNRGRGI